MKYRNNLLRLCLIALFTLFLNVNTASGQNYFAFTPNGFSGWPDSIPRGDSVTIGGWLKNYSPDSVFQDFLYIEGTVDTGAGPIWFSFDFSFLQPTFQLAPGDSGFMLLPFVFDTSGAGGAPQFHVGNNVVVVWPIGVGPGSFVPSDSVELNVFVIDTLSSIGPEPPGSDVKIYPVPANGPLFINSPNPGYHIESVRVYDALGQVVYQSQPNMPASPINTEAWATGLYTIETTLSNGAISYYKILRQ